MFVDKVHGSIMYEKIGQFFSNYGMKLIVFFQGGKGKNKLLSLCLLDLEELTKLIGK